MSDYHSHQEIPTHEIPPSPADQRTGMIATGFIIMAVLAAAVYWSV
jgi:hypothetical protein